MRVDKPRADDVIDVQATMVLPAGEAASSSTALLDAQALVHLVITPHAVSLAGQRHESLPLLGGQGDTVAGLLKRCGVDMAHPQWVVLLGGVSVPRSQWHRVTPKAGQLIEARIRAGEIFTAIFAAVTSFFSSLTLAKIGSLLVTGLIKLAGSIILNKLLAPPKKKQQQQQQVEQTYAVSSVQNQQRPYDMVPILFGNTRIGLDYFGQPYSAFEGGEQYFYAWFSAGVNCGSFADPKIGTTALPSYNEASLLSMGFSEMADQPIAVYTNVDTFPGGQLLTPGPTATPIARTTNAGTVMLALDFEAQVFGINGNGSMATNQFIDYFASYRLLASGAALPFFDATNNQGFPEGAWAGSIRISSQSTKPVRNSFTRSVPEGAYELVVYKVTVDIQTTTQANQGFLTSIRGFQRDNSEDYRIGRLSLRIRASGQLNGAVEQLSIHAFQKPVPLWNGSAWNTVQTSNVGALLLQFIRGIYDDTGRLLGGYGYADARIDVESFKGFMLHCEARSFQFNQWKTDLESCGELAEQMARVGLGSLSRHTGKLGVIWFNDTQPLEGIINMATIKRGSFSVDYYTGEAVDELEISYSDQPSSSALPQEKTLRVQSPVASTFTNVGRMRLEGVRYPAHAALLGRFSMAQNVYQRKSIALEMDYEFISFRRGSLLALSHDLTQWGYSGRLKAAVDNAGVITLTLDEPVPSVNPAGSSVTKMIGLRLLGETQYRTFVVNSFTGPSNVLTLSGAWPGGVALPGSVAGEPAHECVWIYDFKATPGLRARVVSIEPGANESGARITLVPEPDGFWPYVNSGSYLPPANNSLLDRSLPVASNLKVTEQLDLVGTVFFSRLFLTFEATGPIGLAEVWGKWGKNALTKLGETRTTEFETRGLTGENWTFEIRPFDALGRPGTQATLIYTVIGKLKPPEAMQNLQLIMGGNGVLATWSDPTEDDPDWQAAELSTDEAFSLGARITYKKSTTHLIGFMQAGVQTVHGRIWDDARASLVGVSESITVSPPANIQLLRSDVEANTLSVRWADAKTSQPILRYEYKLGTTSQNYEQAEAYGSAGADSRSDVIISPSAGLRRVWFLAYDVAGNAGTPVFIDVNFTLPTDFVLANRFAATFAGAGSNVWVDTGRVYLLYNNELEGSHFSSRGWANDADAIAAGSPVYFEPGATNATYNEEYDLGFALAVTTIKLTHQVTWLAGGGTIETDISHKLNAGDAWTVVNNVNQLVASNLRYMRVTIRALANGGNDLAQLVGMFTECSLKRIYEPFTLNLNASDVGGTPYVTTTGFLDIQAPTANAQHPSSISRLHYVIDDAGATKRVLWFGFDAAGVRQGGQISGQISGV